MGNGPTGHHPAQFDHMRTDFDAELVQKHLAHRAAGHPRYRFPGARALQDVARVLPVVLERAREVRVAGPRTRHLAAPLAPRGVRFGGHHVLPVLPIAIPHEHRDRGAERLAGPHAREPLDLVGFEDRKSTRLNSSHGYISYAVFCLKKKIETSPTQTRAVADAARLL